jgi:hypothetical protein
MKLVGGHGSWSLLFMMKVLVWNFMSGTHEVMTTFILIVLVSVSLYLTVQLYSKCCWWSSLCNLSNVIFLYCANNQSVMLFSQDQLSLFPAFVCQVHATPGSCSLTRASSESISCFCMSYSNRTDIWRWYCRQILWHHHTCTVYMLVLERVHMHIKALQRTWQLSTTNWRKGLVLELKKQSRCGHWVLVSDSLILALSLVYGSTAPEILSDSNDSMWDVWDGRRLGRLDFSEAALVSDW